MAVIARRLRVNPVEGNAMAIMKKFKQTDIGPAPEDREVAHSRFIT